ncbi:MAG: hypothetical protein KatS3mg105_1079 [Gemmatales bacterium]|nr:MAG: hypothetical protein KatS3mg105_1079 [Gemmatales bacterium]
MRTLLCGLLVIFLLATSAWAQSPSIFGGTANSQRIIFKPIDTSRVVAPIVQVPQPQRPQSTGFRLTEFFARLINPTPRNVPTLPQPERSFRLRDFFSTFLFPSFVRPDPPSTSAQAPFVQQPIDLSVFQPIPPFVPGQ